MKNRADNCSSPVLEFHISKTARDRFSFTKSLFSINGQAVLSNFRSVHLFTQIFNEKQDLQKYPDRVLHASELNAMGFIHEILHYIFSLYRERENQSAISKALKWLEKQYTSTELDALLYQFVHDFPTTGIYNKKTEISQYLASKTGNISNREIILEETLMLWLENINPAFNPFKELFDDSALIAATAYPRIVKELHRFFDSQPVFGPDNQNIIEMLQSPAVAVPDSLPGQLKYIRDRWGHLLGDLMSQLLKSLDFLAEELKIRGIGPGEPEILTYDSVAEDDYEHFSPDKNWMPGVVMIAKNTFVWLDQLSRQYRRSITRLDEIPDQELDRLAEYGFTALWLIGLWERSRSSKEIKQIHGNLEAEASAYSLLDYTIAQSLGGWEAFENLKNRCWYRGIRMASDMVPNHTGIDSKWMIEHPDWFIALDHSPFPAYTFNGKNLSHDERVGIFLEDHYYDRSDAAVVFKRYDYWTGDEKYIYHGNDGTTMPWNDTAQLDYLNPEVREAVTQTILHVARNFPIIRFDAAMTLTKKHYQRLWFPIPGTGSDIASRAEYGISKTEFDQRMPNEFWRKVVDRIAAEVPETLLLAEAFWMMEGYFVRTLGMHRVYNSAFMNMLKMEENSKYRATIKNTLEFDPEILKRFVNFLNNPDEETAVKQFGKGDKYFGVTFMMVTMPGLPMFGHGQIDGFEEKYGMEYKRAYWEEVPDESLIQRHKRDIFPVLKKRYLFSEVRNFFLYDYYASDGKVNENVYAYSNRVNDQRVLVFYNNAYESVSGWIKTSVAYNDKSADDGNAQLRQVNLSSGLHLSNRTGKFVIFREHISGLEYIRENRTIHDQGLFVQLEGYQYQLFWDFREVADNQYQHYRELHNMLSGAGVPSIDDALADLHLRPVHQAFQLLLAAGIFDKLYSVFRGEAEIASISFSNYKTQWKRFFQAVINFTGGAATVDIDAAVKEASRCLENSLLIKTFHKRFKVPKKRYYSKSAVQLEKGIKEYKVAAAALLISTILDVPGEMKKIADTGSINMKIIDDLRLADQIGLALDTIDFDASEKEKSVHLLRLLEKYKHLFLMTDPKQFKESMKGFLSDNEIHRFTGVNLYDGILWYHKESFAEVLWTMFAAAVMKITAVEKQPDQVAADIVSVFRVYKICLEASDRAGYQLHQFKELLLY